jgi:hypothetical protein
MSIAASLLGALEPLARVKAAKKKPGRVDRRREELSLDEVERIRV